MKVLHVVASPRGDKSNTLQVSKAFLDSLRDQHPDVVVEVVDLFKVDLPALAGDNIEAKYTLMTGQPIDKRHEDSWRQIERLITQFLSADAYLISSPMWNFGIPYTLKYYVDCIVQPGYVFRYDGRGMVEPLVLGKKMVCVTARGADYSASGPLHTLDFQEPYLRSIFGFIGITDITFINVQPTDISSLRDGAFASALAQVQAVTSSPGWRNGSAADHGGGLAADPAADPAADMDADPDTAPDAELDIEPDASAAQLDEVEV